MEYALGPQLMACTEQFGDVARQTEPAGSFLTSKLCHCIDLKVSGISSKIIPVAPSSANHSDQSTEKITVLVTGCTVDGGALSQYIHANVVS